MFKLAAHFTGGTSGCCSESDDLDELIEEGNWLVKNSSVIWIKIEEKNGPTVLECRGDESWFNESYSKQLKKCRFGKRYNIRKLRPAEMNVLKAMPEDRVFESKILEKTIFIPGQTHPSDLPLPPKSFNFRTIRNLYRMGLIMHGFYLDKEFNPVKCSHGRCFSPYSCPIQLTNKGRKLLGRKEIE